MSDHYLSQTQTRIVAVLLLIIPALTLANMINDSIATGTLFPPPHSFNDRLLIGLSMAEGGLVFIGRLTGIGIIIDRSFGR